MKWIAILFAAVLLVSCAAEEGPKEAKYELTEVDFFTLLTQEDLKGDEVSVLGVKVGDNKNHVLETLGTPFNFTMFSGEGLVIENYEFRKSLGLNKTGLIVQIHNDVVYSITVREPFNKYLKGETVIKGRDSDIYFLIGTPDVSEIIFRYILLKYDRFGLDIITFRANNVGFTLRSPTETNREISTEIEEQILVPYSDEMVFN